MKILFNDVLQKSDMAYNLKTSSLAEIEEIRNEFVIHLDKEYQIDSIGIGNTDGTVFSIYSSVSVLEGEVYFDINGLYTFKPIVTSYLLVHTDATYIGRFAAGIGIRIPTSVQKSFGYNSTAAPRTTLSGQQIQGLGGYNFKTLTLDSRYKLDETAISEISNGMSSIGKGYPFFIDLTDESYKLPFYRLYATETNQLALSFESGVKNFLYSRKWNFEEKF